MRRRRAGSAMLGAGLVLMPPEAEAVSVYDLVVAGHVTFPVRPKAPVRGGVRLGFRAAPVATLGETPSVGLTGTVGGSMRIDGGIGQVARLDLLLNLGLAMGPEAGPVDWAVGLETDLGVAFQLAKLPSGLMLGGRLWGRGPTAPTLELGAGAIWSFRPVMSEKDGVPRSWSGQVTLGTDIGRALFPGLLLGGDLGGRPLRQGGSVVCASVDAPAGLSRHQRRVLREAAFEWTSVAAFVRTARELAALGAPDELVRRAVDAAWDELRHARARLEEALSMGVAWARLGAVDATPRRFPEQGAGRETLGREGWFDGWLNECAASRTVRAEARGRSASGDRVRLLEIADEEMGHAQLGADIARWAVA